MKYSVLWALSILVCLSSCTKETKDLFEKSADERISEVLAGFQTALVAEPGWKLFVYPQGLKTLDVEVGGLTYYIKFSNTNRVTMISDFRANMAATPKESGYRLRAIQSPSLVFDTYSYMHIAADPDPEVSFSPASDAGYGWGTDFDFAFTESAAVGDTIKLKGNYNNSEALLIKISQQEIDEAFGGKLADMVQATDDFLTATPFHYFQGTDNARISVAINLFLFTINFNRLDASQELAVHSSPFSRTTTGIHLKNPITEGGYTFQDLFWDDALQTYYIQSGATRVNIINSSDPAFPFYKELGKSITTISVPDSTLPGQSALFTTNRNMVKTDLLTGRYGLKLGTMFFIFDSGARTMALNAIIQQDGTNFLAQYVYSYTFNNSGIAKFTFSSTNGNGRNIRDDFAPLLDYIEGDHFKMDYFTGATPVLGEFRSQEHPTFYFTGNIQ